MQPGLLELLCCPRCKGALRIQDETREDSRIESGTLVCVDCGTRYPVLRGIPRFVASDDYLRNFTLEWKVHSKTPYDEALGVPLNDFWFKTRIGLGRDAVDGKLVLDAGCGSGRYLKLIRDWNGTAVGLDYSFAIDSAASNLWPDERVHLVQGDILNPPFKRAVFDSVFSSGVIHHTPDPPRAFSSLTTLVKEGGEISVWVYPDEGVLGRIPNRVGALYRAVAKEIPDRVLYRLCKTAQENLPFPSVLYEDFFDVSDSLAKGHVHPRQAIYVLLPFWSLSPYKEWRVMDTYDFLSAKYKFFYSYDQVIRWFQKEGLVEVRKSEFPVGARGRKPAAVRAEGSAAILESTAVRA